MKKLLVSLALALGFTSLVTAQNLFRVPASSYKLSASESETFIDLSKIRANDGGWTLSGETYTKDIYSIAATDLQTLGADMTEHQSLTNGFFYYDPSTQSPKFKKVEAVSYKLDPDEMYSEMGVTKPSQTECTLTAFPLSTPMRFLGKTMTHFVIGADGSVLFSDSDTRYALGQMQNNYAAEDPDRIYQDPEYSGDVSMLSELVAVIPYYDNWGASFAGVARGTEAPVHYALVKNTQTSSTMLIVQFDYLANYREGNEDIGIEAMDGDRWIYQLQISDNDIKLVVHELSITNSKKAYIGFDAFQDGMGVHAIGGTHTTHILVGNEDEECWTNPMALSSLTYGNFAIDASCAPQSGWALAITAPDECPKTIAVPTDQQITYGEVTSTSNMLSTTLEFNADQFTAESAAALGMIIAVASTSETPIALTNGQLYAKGDKIGDAEVVTAATVEYYNYGGLEFSPFSIAAMNLNASTTYYIHLYMMAYQCEGAPMYSNCFKTLTGETGMGAPNVSVTAVTTEKVTLSINQPKTYGTVLIQSDTLANVALTDKMTIGEKIKIGDKEVGTVLAILPNTTTSYELSFDTPGDGAYIWAYTIEDPESETAKYAEAITRLTVQTAFEKPIGRVDFKDFPSATRGEDFSPTYEAPLMPFGWTAEDLLLDPQLNKSFAVTDGYAKIPKGLKGYEPGGWIFADGTWAPQMDMATRGFACANVFVDAVTPPFIAAGTNIQAIYTVSITNPSAMPIENFYTPTVNDKIVIEYSLNFGEWQEAAHFTGNDLTPGASSHNLTANATCTPTDVVRFRYRFISNVVNIAHIITSAEFLEIRNCVTPTDIDIVDDKSTSQEIAIVWKDENNPKARSFRVEYQEYTDNDNAEWQSRTINRAAGSTDEMMEATLYELKKNTVYHIRLTAMCTNEEESHTSQTVEAKTFGTLPYHEDFSGRFTDASNPFTRGITLYSGDAFGQMTPATPSDFGTPWAMPSPQDMEKEAGTLHADNLCTANDHFKWLVTPTIYINTNDVAAKTLRYTLSTARGYNSDDLEEGYGVKTSAEGVKLMVLASTSKEFSLNDTLATYALDQIGFNNDTIEMPLQLNGSVRVAFVYQVPVGAEDYAFKLLISDLNYDYDAPQYAAVENLTSSNPTASSITLAWKGEAMEYGVFWKESDAENFNETPKTVKETTCVVDGLEARTQYDFQVIAYYNEDHSHASEPTVLEGIWTAAAPVVVADTFEVALTASPAEAGTVTGAGKYAEGDTVTVSAAANKGFVFVAWTNDTDTLSRTATYKFEMPGEDVAYTAVFKEEVSNEELLKAGFNVSTKDGQLIVRNLNAVTVKDVDIYGLTGNRINRFVLYSREDLMLPVDAQRAILFVRLNTEQGVAIYKVYLQ